jgi:hypothetical protein
MGTDTSTSVPGGTLAGIATEAVVPICVPESNTIVYEVLQVQVPLFLSFHVFVNVAPGS